MSGYKKIDVLIAVMAIAMIVVVLLITKQDRNADNISQTIIIEPTISSVEAITLNSKEDIERIMASSTIDETIKDIIKTMPSPQPSLQ